jgi:hypothetical protein
VLSQGPRATVKARHEVAIARPRNLLDARRDPAFGPLLKQLWDQMADESPAADAGIARDAAA